MGFLKARWRLIVFAVVCLASLGTGGWAYMSGADIDEKLQSLAALKRSVEGARSNPVNARTIEARQKQIEASNSAISKTLATALAMQMNNPFESQVDSSGKFIPAARRPLGAKIDEKTKTWKSKVLPKLEGEGDAAAFRDDYRRAMGQLTEKLHGRDRPRRAEIEDYGERRRQLEQQGGAGPQRPWGPIEAASHEENPTLKTKNRTLIELLREWPSSRLADEISHRVYMYVDENAFGRHPLASSTDNPTDVDIWQAQMSLWIQQDIAYVLSRLNEERAEELRKKGATDRVWVGHMPVKRLVKLVIDDRLGKGGGSNVPRGGLEPAFTSVQNDKSMFVVPLQLDLVIEEAMVPRLLDQLCRVGFYTPTSIAFRAVTPNPLQEDYIYGEDAIVQLVIEMEGCYFRKVLDPWIPKTIGPILEKPGAGEQAEKADR